jgi:hypothetical protein
LVHLLYRYWFLGDKRATEGKAAMIKSMGTLRVTEAELARDVHAILSKVQEGMEVIVENDNRAVAVIRMPISKGRLLSESIALAEAHGTTAIPDEGFMKDVEEGIAEINQPWNPRPGSNTRLQRRDRS